MRVTVVHARPGAQHVLPVEVPPGATVADAIVTSGLLALEPQLELQALSVGIWNRTVDLHARLVADDRVEVYRPLTLDPKEARRLRAEARRRRGAGLRKSG